jgi:hypothetical protein
MDLESQTLVSTITGSFQCRAIAYSEDDDWLYMSGWGDPVYIVEKDGTIVDTFDLSLTTSTYGFAYDKWDEAAPLFGYMIKAEQVHKSLHTLLMKRNSWKVSGTITI